MTDAGKMRKQYHFWRSDDGFDAWDVDQLIGLSSDLPIESVDIDSIDEIDSVYWFDEVHPPTVRAVVDHARLIDEVDSRPPVILGPDGRVMDGMHRIARALREGQSKILAVRFRELPPPAYRNVRPGELPYER